MLNTVSVKRRNQLKKVLLKNGIKVNIGSGGEGLNDWCNVDIRRHHGDQDIAWDIRRDLPFRDGQVKCLFAEHVVEHLDFKEDVPLLFDEAFRVLSKKGIFRIIVPDGERWVDAYSKGTSEAFKDLGFPQGLPKDMPTPMCMLNHVFHQDGEHQFAWDFDTLEFCLRRAGFREVIQQKFKHSCDDEFAIDLAHHSPYSLYVEGVKN